MATRSKTWSWSDDVVPFVAMLMVTCLDMSLLTIIKAVMNGGMASIVYIVYHVALATLILLPFFVIHIFRNRPPLTFRLLFRFFILGLLGLCVVQILLYLGVAYSSPTMASAIANLGPGTTFLVAVIFRMEKIDIKSSSSVAKFHNSNIRSNGVHILPRPAKILSPDHSPDNLFMLQPSNWVVGGLILVISGTVSSIWNVLQTATHCLFLLPFWVGAMHSCISFPRTKSACLGAATRSSDICCFLWGGLCCYYSD